MDADHARFLDRNYRWQRHIYDATRKFFLLGRDRLIRGLGVAPTGTVLEIGCGTARNLVLIAGRYPTARLYGLDLSQQMLATAQCTLTRQNLQERVTLARGDATRFDAEALFGVRTVDRIVFSYALSMIPDWQSALAQAFMVLAPDGELHIVDFGTGAHLPALANVGLRAWLARFHVIPPNGLEHELRRLAQADRRPLHVEPLLRTYAVSAVIGPASRPQPEHHDFLT